jgi:uncharacterized membrane protein YfcA
MELTSATVLLGLASGLAVGFALGVVGGGGSVLAVPLLVHAVGMPNAHEAIGTGAVAVAANALVGLAQHARAGHVRWRCAALFAALGAAGAVAGAQLGKRVDGPLLLALFALLMTAVGVLMLRGAARAAGGDGPENEPPRLTRANAQRLAGAGLAVGLLAGFFGIGGGFLVAPVLVRVGGFPMRYAIGSSLLAVFAFGAGAAGSYAAAGLVNWRVAALFVAGGALGSALGVRAGRRIGTRRGALERLFAALVLTMAAFVLWRALVPA